METSGASVATLLQALYARIHDQRHAVDLRDVLSSYQRLLAPKERLVDPETHVYSELQRIRQAMRDQGNDLFNLVETLDDCVDACLEPEDATIPALEVVRLLVGLAGGSDGKTFVLEDPTRVVRREEATSDRRIAQRIGDRIHMQNVDLVLQSRVLFGAPAIALEGDRVKNSHQLEHFAPVNELHRSLWYPDGYDAPKPRRVEEKADLSADWWSAAVTSTQFMSLSSDTSVSDDPPVPTQSRHAKSIAPSTWASAPNKSMQLPSETKEVFFFDGTKEIYESRTAEGESTTEGSSGDDDERRSWASWSYLPLAPASWEELGSHHPSPDAEVEPTAWITHELPVDADKQTSGTTLEVDEADIVEDAIKALCGVESVFFRRDIPAATLRLPRKFQIKTRTSSTKSLTSIIEQVRDAGTAYLRLEYLAVYYSQDPNRGGKTAQALAHAVLIYLTFYQKTVGRIRETSTKNSYQLLLWLSKTRELRRQIQDVVMVLCDDNKGSFWALLSSGSFPRGVALLNHLHKYSQKYELEDATGQTSKLLQWLLVKATTPYVEMVSAFVSSGTVLNSSDPFNEFRLSVYTVLIGYGGDDAYLLSLDEENEICPAFLGSIAGKLLHIGRLQQLLANLTKSAHQLPANCLELLPSFFHASTRSQLIQAMMAEFSDRIHRAVSAGPTLPAVATPAKSPRADEDDTWVVHKRKRIEVKQQLQRTQREMLEAQIQEQKQQREAEAERDRQEDEARMKERKAEETRQLEHGKELLVERYAGLMQEAEDRQRYMIWRRSRALRISSARQELIDLHKREREYWESYRGKGTIPEILTALEEESQLVTEQSADTDDVHMEEARDNDDNMVPSPAIEVLEVPTEPVKLTPVVNSIDEDGGVLWRPTIRIRQVPGGGGSDAHGSLYPDQAQSDTTDQSLKATQFSSVRLLQVSGGGGNDAYNTIYGGDLKDMKTPDKFSSVRMLREAGGGGDLAKVSLYGDHQPPQHPRTETSEDLAMKSSSVGETEGDVDMMSQHEADVDVNEVDHGMLPAESQLIDMGSYGREERSETEDYGVQLGFLQHSTSFFSEHVDKWDEAALSDAISEKPPSFLPAVPFRLLIENALIIPINTVHDSLDQLALYAVQTKLKIQFHLKWLHRIMLMGEGLCMSIFARDFASGLWSPSRMLWKLEDQLTNILLSAMVESRIEIPDGKIWFDYRITDAFVSLLESGPSIPSVTELLSQLSLTYRGEPHLDAVLSGGSLANYTKIHRFLLHLRITEHELKSAWLMWRKSSYDVAPSYRRKCDVLIHFGHSLLSAFNETFTTQIVISRWEKLQATIGSIDSVRSLRVAHDEFTEDVLACCFLDSDSDQVHMAIQELLEITWSVGKLIRLVDQQDGDWAGFESGVEDLANRHASAMRRLITLLEELEVCEDQCVRHFSKYLLLRLDLSGFYGNNSLVY
ncbi:hypothetical protein Poli38472_000401 [Pythium oligandrum]|uniref:Gamma tubulin complex component C-terminal domain-containing protein n=1 Tax=Pythium oligandrum TaxID=41045 RepID=A0A8K1FGU1_PYTOL|nr:hypothetical protein Poli38472_000401 [Pythium oligandrum]|eukprot:TMW60359.1 hypothetical protein Poli38472_000401 [Pythium oligandrum]